MRSTFTLLMGLLAVGLTAQEGSDLGWVHGKVRDGVTKSALPYVTVLVYSDSKSAIEVDTTITDFDGLFVVRCPKARIEVCILHDGYLAFKREADTRSGMVFVDADLEPMKVIADPRPDRH